MRDMEQVPDGERVVMKHGLVMERESLHRWTVLTDEGTFVAGYLVRVYGEWSFLNSDEKPVQVPGLPTKDTSKAIRIMQEGVRE